MFSQKGDDRPSLPKLNVAMYGLTSEAYKLAAELVEKAQVTIIDETLQMAMVVDSPFLKKNPNLGQLMSEEPLLGLKPIESVLGEAQIVFFTPRLRRPSDEALIEASTKMRDVSKYLSKGVIFVNTLPTGPGGNSENIMLLEKQTGLKIAESINYAYVPLRPRDPRPTVVATAGREIRHLRDLGFNENSQNIFSAELEYASFVIGSTIGAVTEIELSKRAREANVSLQKVSETYIDDFTKYLYDLKTIQASDETGESISYLAGAIVKSLENYVRYVVDETREVLKEKELKASRTKISLLWTLDRYEMRGERVQVSDSVQLRLRDYVTDVEVIPGSSVKAGSEVLDPLKHNIVIACSKEDNELVRQVKKGHRNLEMTLLPATPILKAE
jgi:hypothetical protein